MPPPASVLSTQGLERSSPDRTAGDALGRVAGSQMAESPLALCFARHELAGLDGRRVGPALRDGSTLLDLVGETS